MNEQALFTPIRRRLVAWTVLVVSVILLLLGTAVYATVSRSLVDQVDRDLVTRSSTDGGRPHPGERDGYRGGTFSLSLGPDGAVVANPQQVQTDGISGPTAQPGGTLATITVDDEPTRIFAIRAPDGGTLISGDSLQPEQTAMRTLLVVLVAGGGLGHRVTPDRRWGPGAAQLLGLARPLPV